MTEPVLGCILYHSGHRSPYILLRCDEPTDNHLDLVEKSQMLGRFRTHLDAMDHLQSINKKHGWVYLSPEEEALALALILSKYED